MDPIFIAPSLSNNLWLLWSIKFDDFADVSLGVCFLVHGLVDLTLDIILYSFIHFAHLPRLISLRHISNYLFKSFDYRSAFLAEPYSSFLRCSFRIIWNNWRIIHIFLLIDIKSVVRIGMGSRMGWTLFGLKDPLPILICPNSFTLLKCPWLFCLLHRHIILHTTWLQVLFRSIHTLITFTPYFLLRRITFRFTFRNTTAAAHLIIL